MNKWIFAIFASFLMGAIQAAEPGKNGYLPMPPTFTLDARSDQVLKDYPLGEITKEAAFAHHGQAHKVVTLPNGLDGWVYEFSPRDKDTYTMPSGEKKTVESLEHTNIHASYTLVFDDKGVVIDVLYRAPGREDARSALLEQRQAMPDVEKEPWRSKHMGNE